MGPGDLTRALSALRPRSDSRLVVGHETYDDAGIFVLSPDLALVQTVDFFAPIVDDPFVFGQIAAANALSDVYAMGGEPMTALNIVGFPAGRLPMEVLSEILLGGQAMVHQAGALVVGGHTVIDDEVKFGLAVTGRVHPDRILRNSAARPGDRLLLTKPLGTGILSTWMKRGDLPDAWRDALHASMLGLNAGASRAAVAAGAIAATDVTGFGLLGHAYHMALASGCSIRVRADAVPTLPGVRQALADGLRTGGAERNAAYLDDKVDWGTASDADRALLIDPQTSGGLLISIAPEMAGRYLSQVPGAVDIGEVLPDAADRIVLA